MGDLLLGLGQGPDGLRMTHLVSSRTDLLIDQAVVQRELSAGRHPEEGGKMSKTATDRNEGPSGRLIAVTETTGAHHVHLIVTTLDDHQGTTETTELHSQTDQNVLRGSPVTVRHHAAAGTTTALAHLSEHSVTAHQTPFPTPLLHLSSSTAIPACSPPFAQTVVSSTSSTSTPVA
jgi:hypothetical protein